MYFFNCVSRIRRAASDQRIAELQALIALANGGGSSIGHGQFDPFAAYVEMLLWRVHARVLSLYMSIFIFSPQLFSFSIY